MLNDEERAIRTMALAALRRPPYTLAEIREAVLRCATVIGVVDDAGVVLDESVRIEQVIRDVETAIVVFVEGDGGVKILGDDTDHLEWLAAKRTTVEWRYWDRYKHWLRFDQGLPAAVVDDLDDTTDEVLGRLEDPARRGAWDRRGMVVGHVQSGKTGHYTGLICKAVDAGYRLIVVLAGTDNGLRSQTQLRLDQGFLGFTMGYGTGDQRGQYIGVGCADGFPPGEFPAISLTMAAQNGDFRTAVARGMGIIPGAAPIILVVKKNGTVLRNLINWAKAVLGSERDGVHKIPKLPMLVIDDECDYASVNTKNTVEEFRQNGERGEPTKINGLIRQLLTMFDQSAYVGYTATPFANIFIYHDPKAEREVYGEDLFPRSFIVCLARTSDYMGADRIFGLKEDLQRGIGSRAALPIIRPFGDLEAWIAPRHDRRWIPPTTRPPQSLREAMLAFVLVCAARSARGHEREHNSMLIHLSRFQDVQGEIFSVVEAELLSIRHGVRNHTARDPRPVVEELRVLWETDFLETTVSIADPNLRPVAWDELAPHIRTAVEKIKVKTINGKSEDALDYHINRELGVSVIAVGGAKLSRGLTLEGLSVSYFQRTSEMYDTLMQMGRWFGYRPGYADLCRLYTTDELIGWYRDITMATEELYLQFEEMRIVNATPKEFGLKVATSPNNLMVTARVKMRHATELRLSYAGENPSYRRIRPDAVPDAISATQQLVRWAAASGEKRDPIEGPSHVYTGLDHSGVVEFLNAFPQYPGVTTSDPRILRDYVLNCNRVGELTRWTVALISVADENRPTVELEGLQVRLQTRTSDGGRDPLVNTLWDPQDESLGLSESELRRAEAAGAAVPPAKRRGVYFRRGRDKQHGLLVVYLLDPSGLFKSESALVSEEDRKANAKRFAPYPLVPLFAISLPSSNSAPAINYVVRNDYWNNEDEDLEVDE